MTVRELYKALCAIVPRELGCDWDKDGLNVCPEPEREVKKVLVALDATAAVVDKAITEGYDVVFSHHPMLWDGLKTVDADDALGAKVVKLCKSGVAAISFHTRIDAAKGGVNDILASLVGLENVETSGVENIMRVGNLPAPVSAAEFAACVKNALHCPAVLCSDAGKPVSRVAVVGGSGKDEISVALAAGADTFLTGELKYSQLSEPTGINLLVAGHFYTENPICERLCALVKEVCPEAQTDIEKSCKVTVV
ncbi:MAG: Nif3-like dinuclear metal center hexameric protein [Clostridia bacterium]|nr:Nif3-like dinuclear metal center hexameric protein [Clostridia bacterium]